MPSKFNIKTLIYLLLWIILIIEFTYAGDDQAKRTIFSHIQIGMNYGITPFDSKHDTPMHYRFDIGYRFKDRSAVQLAINIYQLWNEGEEGTNYRTYPGKYNEVNIAVVYFTYLDEIIPLDYLNNVSIGSGIGLNNDSHNSWTFSFTPAYNLKITKSLTIPFGLTFIFNPNSLNNNVYSNNYWGIFLGIRYH